MMTRNLIGVFGRGQRQAGGATLSSSVDAAHDGSPACKVLKTNDNMGFVALSDSMGNIHPPIFFICVI